ncbi:lipid-A-disaccharide synthase [Anditalea andensis]|uniref:Lipid-A-disaccharide synthase n=1 Tax=Anditalea andensis TaxID=1048983 RepID=A0A074L009_9BACT|nr:lipid-A-disaccharide synthase [Anditalea andensis]KEO74514.1 lipid-A-disaccharide synthase [Anditalea andensis]
MKYYIIAGERSGDLHAGNLIHEIKKLDPKASFRGMGGDYAIKEGLSIAAHYDKVALMGFLEVVLGFRKVLKYLSLIKKDLLAYHPDALILVDYGGFNMKIAKFAKANGITVHYFIPPKVWAWNQKRAYKLKETVDHIYSILPFEKAFFAGFGMDIHYVGNPLLDEIAKFKHHDFFHQKNALNYQPIIALLPGSRKQEVRNMLSTMVGVIPQFPNAQFVIAGVANLEAKLYQPALDLGVKIVFDQTYDLLHHATAAVVTSGTATLETALFRVPQVVVYKTSWMSYAIARKLIKVTFISLVNLIAGKEVVKELIQDDMSVEKVSLELNTILTSTLRKAEIFDGYTEIKEKIGEKMASEETARLIAIGMKK